MTAYLQGNNAFNANASVKLKRSRLKGATLAAASEDETA